VSDDVSSDYAGKFAFYEAYEPSEWQCELFGAGRLGIVFRPRKGDEPNWFWRWMQYLAFGNRWRKV
jgi:hypothetical protein